MIDAIVKLGGWGGIGLLGGIALVIWIEPTSTGGIGLIVLVAIVFAMVVGYILSALFGGKKDSKSESE